MANRSGVDGTGCALVSGPLGNGLVSPRRFGLARCSAGGESICAGGFNSGDCSERVYRGSSSGLVAGLFLIPLNAALQAESHKDKLGKTIATQNEGTEQLVQEIKKHLEQKSHADLSTLWAEKAYQLILKQKMNGISKKKLKEEIEKEIKKDDRFNIYRFIKSY